MGKEKSLAAVVESLGKTLDLPQALRYGLEALRDEIPADGIFININEAGSVVFLARATADEAVPMSDRVRLPPGLASELSYEKREELMIVDDRADDPVTDYVLSRVIPEVRSFLMMRLLYEGRHAGIVCLYSRRRAAFSADELKLLGGLRNQFSLMVGFMQSGRLRSANETLRRENRRLQESDAPVRELLQSAPSLRSITPLLVRIAPIDATVLVTGESGSGKEVVATTIHQMSPRRFKPFVKVNCGAIPRSMIEAELFGYEKGAFTDARTRHLGIFEQADGGTLLLDEVGELPLDMQVKLLRVLQTRALRRLGGEREIGVDVRVIASTNRDLGAMVREGSFRMDLYYRLNVFPIEVKPLREREEDIEPLSRLLLSQLAAKYRLGCVPVLGDAALREAKAWKWPGNIRELRNAMARAALTGRRVIEKLDLEHEAPSDAAPDPAPSGRRPREATPSEPLPSFDEMQVEYFTRLLRACGGRIAGPGGAAEVARMHPNTLRSRLAKLGFSPRRMYAGPGDAA